jgi:ribosomal protein L37AE/L43A
MPEETNKAESKPQSAPQPENKLACPYCTATAFTRIEMGSVVNGVFKADHDEYQCAGCHKRGPVRDFTRE